MDNQTYSTTDLPTAALLLTNKKIEFLGMSQKASDVWEFNFQPYLFAKDLAFRFLCGKERVNGLEFSLAIKRCKDLVFAEKRK